MRSANSTRATPSISTEKKWKEKQRAHEKGVGWPQCKTISDNGGKPHCKPCPHFSKGESPLNLGLDAVKAGPVDKEIQELAGTQPPEARLPEGFCFDEKGQLCVFHTGTHSQ